MLDKLREDLKQAQLSRDEIKVSTLRLLISEIKNAEIKKGADLDEPEIEQVIARELKKRKEAILGFRQGGREEAAQKEESEAKILESYLPPQLSDEELTNLVTEAMSEAPTDAVNKSGAKEGLQIGQIIGMVISKAGGKVDGTRVAAKVKELLAK